MHPWISMMWSNAFEKEHSNPPAHSFSDTIFFLWSWRCESFLEVKKRKSVWVHTWREGGIQSFWCQCHSPSNIFFKCKKWINLYRAQERKERDHKAFFRYKTWPATLRTAISSFTEAVWYVSTFLVFGTMQTETNTKSGVITAIFWLILDNTCLTHP